MLPVKGAVFINHCIHISSVREAFTAASTAKILYQHTERIPEHPDDVEMKAVLKNIAVKNANMLLPGDMRPSWNLEFVPTDETCVVWNSAWAASAYSWKQCKGILADKGEIASSKSVHEEMPQPTLLSQTQLSDMERGYIFQNVLCCG